MSSKKTSSAASSQTDENRMESISPQRRGARRDDSSFFFAAETPAKKNRHALPSGLEAGQGLITSKNLREALGLSLFCPLSRKGKNVFLCDLCASSEAPQGRDKRAVRHRSIHVTAKPWPRPGMQRLNFIARESLILEWQ